MTHLHKQDPAIPSRVLALDTATAVQAVALLEQGRTVASQSSHAERNHSIQLVPVIEEILNGNGTSPSGVNGIAVGIGPGSYTGVRIGISVAKTMAWALEVPVIGVSSLEALARTAYAGDVEPEVAAEGAAAGDAPSGDESPLQTASVPTVWVVPLLNARRGQAYTALYAAEPDGSWRTLASDGIRLVRDWAEALLTMATEREESGAASTGVPRLLFAGEIEGFQEEIGSLAERWSGEVTAAAAEIDAAWIGQLGIERWSRGEQDDLHALVPNYTQLAEAEVKLNAKQREGGGANGAC